MERKIIKKDVRLSTAKEIDDLCSFIINEMKKDSDRLQMKIFDSKKDENEIYHLYRNSVVYSMRIAITFDTHEMIVLFKTYYLVPSKDRVMYNYFTYCQTTAMDPIGNLYNQDDMEYLFQWEDPIIHKVVKSKV